MSVQLKTPVRTAPPAARRLVVPLGGDVDDGQFSLLFDGASGAIQMGTAPAIMPAGSLSLACWVKFLGIGTNQHIMGRGQGLGGPSPFTLTLFGTSGNLVYFDLTNDAGTRATANSTTVFTTGRWYHLAATWDGTAGVGGVKLYVNGALASTGPSVAMSANIDGNPLRLGSASSFTGRMTTATFGWNRAATPRTSCSGRSLRSNR
jgi:hypothetical protein